MGPLDDAQEYYSKFLDNPAMTTVQRGHTYVPPGPGHTTTYDRTSWITKTTETPAEYTKTWTPLNAELIGDIEDRNLRHAVVLIQKADKTKDNDEVIERLNEIIVTLSEVVKDRLGEY